MRSDPARLLVSIGLQSDKAPDDYAAIATAVESLGFDGVSVYADLGFQPPWQPLTLIARHTSRLRVGPACVNPFTTHPIDIAGNAATLDLVSGGRSYVGITKGTWLDQLGVSTSHGADALRDSVAIVRRVIAGDTGGYTGAVFSLAPGFALRYDRQRPHIPVLLGAWGPKAVAVAGETADELKVGGSANPDLAPVIRGYLQVGARRSHRDAADVSLVFGAVSVVDDDGERARRVARREVAMYLAVLADLDPTVDVPTEVAEPVRSLVAAGDHDGAGRLIPDDLLHRFCFAGTPDEVADHASRLVEAGVDRVEFGTPHGVDSLHGIELIGRTVLPALRSLWR